MFYLLCGHWSQVHISYQTIQKSCLPLIKVHEVLIIHGRCVNSIVRIQSKQETGGGA